MRTLYFNDILPDQCENDVIAVFEQAVVQTSRLAKNLNLNIPFILGSTTDKITICGITLAEVIRGCRDKNVRTKAYSLFSHAIIRNYEDLTLEDYDPIIKGDYKFDGKDATNLAIAHKMDWPLLSLPLNDALKKDFLTLSSCSCEDIEAANYYAQVNTGFIEQWFESITAKGLTGLARLCALLGPDRVIVAQGFEKEWDAANKLYQGIVYKRFKYALESGRLKPGEGDDVTVQKDEVKGKPDVYELRQTGQGIRVYFGYSDDGSKIVLAVFNTKSSAAGVEQSADIIRAQGRIRKALAWAVE